MMQYAQDAMKTNTPWELWEFRKENSDEPWDDLVTHPMWCEYFEYRRKPRTININGHEVPEPIREPPKYNSPYYMPEFKYPELYERFFWEGDHTDMHRLKSGLMHLTKDAAIAHARALLSFTTQKVSDE
ncbi:hypothetical protein CO615_04175 [Lysobacteraceae bacterium NML75-0749]|nr:hypothetical protein CO615_04175 [Xanthomonadaceae bacterium NML75-0749]